MENTKELDSCYAQLFSPSANLVALRREVCLQKQTNARSCVIVTLLRKYTSEFGQNNARQIITQGTGQYAIITDSYALVFPCM